jgi:putative membrane protein
MHIRFSRVTPAAVAAIALGASVAAAQVTTTSGGDVTMFSQKNLVNHLIVGDSIEVEMAQLAASRTQNAAVKDFANQLVTDHKAHLEQLNKFAASASIGREANASDTTATHLSGLLAGLKTMPADSTFDRAFVQEQIEHHQAAINGLKSTRASATDAELQKDIDATLPILEKHLATAQQLASQLGKPGADPAQKPDSAAAAGTKPPAVKPPVAKPPV